MGHESPWWEIEMGLDFIFLVDMFYIIFSTSESENMNTITDFYENFRLFARTLLVPTLISLFPAEVFSPTPGTKDDYLLRFIG